ncbi:NAD(P)/FAD-dependent oxidoreductase [Ornithinimicrobium pratense]|uniref:FAD-binding protein n=1 Tax=Ornithinimicrobium pratense TaxID=2593973 RepID=A0A5J6V357_9MICO|nr:FAD-dependent monooxygenase [Ornithinimicrobium pratense]QFG68299.1 FAD-binding protein [Ornithinimicrobium pratense]
MDLLVVGGGPVGLVVALRAADAGLTVTVLEPRHGPVDKACGEGLMPAARERLAQVGAAPNGHDLASIVYTDGRHRVSAPLTRPGLGVRRTVLHAALLEAADRAGVQVRHTRMIGIEPGDPRDHARPARVRTSDGQERTAPFVVAADGLHSPTRRALGLERPARLPRRFGLRAHYAVAPWSDAVEVHWSRNAEAYVTPVADDLVGVALLCRPPGRWDPTWRSFPELAWRLAGSEQTSAVRGAGPLRQRVRSMVRGRVLLVGDAAGYVDALTGEGLTLGTAQAFAAVDAVLAGSPAQYARRAPALGRRSTLLTRGLLAVSGQPAIRRLIVPAAARVPAVYRGAVHQLAGGH